MTANAEELTPRRDLIIASTTGGAVALTLFIAGLLVWRWRSLAKNASEVHSAESYRISRGGGDDNLDTGSEGGELMIYESAAM